MNLTDKHELQAHGHIMAYAVDRTTGKVEMKASRPNVITFNAADLMAKILGGETAYIPSHVGFIYAPSAKSFTNPGVDRDQLWSRIEHDVQDNNGNMLICPITSAPVYGTDGVVGRYVHNVVTVGSLSDNAAARAFSGPDFKNAVPAGSDSFFQVVLLSRKFIPGSVIPQYIPFARAGLQAGSGGIPVQTESDLMIYWTISFK